jgi:hypothetical protein
MDEWRLKVRAAGAGSLDGAVRRLRGSGEQVLGATVGGTLPSDAVLSHQGDTLFVYAPTRARIDIARSAVVAALRAERHDPAWSISVWDGDVVGWRQVEPPLVGDEQLADAARVLAAGQPTTRTLTCTTVGRWERQRLARIADHAPGAGVRCAVTEERWFVATRVTLAVTGPAAKVDAFLAYAEREIKQMRYAPGAPAGP